MVGLFHVSWFGSAQINVKSGGTTASGLLGGDGVGGGDDAPFGVAFSGGVGDVAIRAVDDGDADGDDGGAESTPLLSAVGPAFSSVRSRDAAAMANRKPSCAHR